MGGNLKGRERRGMWRRRLVGGGKLGRGGGQRGGRRGESSWGGGGRGEGEGGRKR